jgi:predicted 2-oxoglutarate/Fe(II)-dependent dioxygenase YbiX
MSCFFLYSASRRASLSAQAAKTVYYLFELKSPHVTASPKFNRFRNRTDAEKFVRVAVEGILDHEEIEEISQSMANKLKNDSPEQVEGGVLYKVELADYRRMHSFWNRALRMFQK